MTMCPSPNDTEVGGRDWASEVHGALAKKGEGDAKGNDIHHNFKTRAFLDGKKIELKKTRNLVLSVQRRYILEEK